MEQNDHELENFLREFTPRQPRALPAVPANVPVDGRIQGHWNWQRLAAALLLTVASGMSVWFASTQSTPTTVRNVSPTAASAVAAASGTALPSPMALERLALEDPAQFESTISAASRRILPRGNETDDTLRLLEKD